MGRAGGYAEKKAWVLTRGASLTIASLPEDMKL